MEEQLITTEVEVAPDTLTMIMPGSWSIALRAEARAFPLQVRVDPLEFQVDLGFFDDPGALEAKQLSDELRITHTPILRRPPNPSLHPLKLLKRRKR